MRWLTPFGILILVTISGFTVLEGNPSLEKAIQDATRKVLATHFPDDVWRLSVRVDRTAGDIDSHKDFRIQLPSNDGFPRAHTRVDLLQKGVTDTWEKKGWALLYISHYDSVLIACRTLRADEPLKVEDISFSWIETTRFPGDPIHPREFRNGADDLFARRLIREGQVIRLSDVRPPYMTRIGQSVKMQFCRDRITLSLSCKARENGFLGDTIRLYSPERKAFYRARLTGPGMAEWVETL